MMEDGFIGKRFNRLLVLSRGEDYIVPSTGRPSKRYNCLCDCGNTKLISRGHLSNGAIRSCGCLRDEKLVKMSTTHGKSKSRLNSIWANMKSRCNNPNVECYPHYGGRGTKVCDEWLTFEGFISNLPEGYQEDLELDRRDVDGDYCPDNCRWVTRGVNCSNKRDKPDGTPNGVSYNTRDDLWKATITVDGKRKNKYFKDKQDAVNQRLAWNKEHGI
jgi:hypothetical protein